MAGGVAIAKSCSCRRCYLLCAGRVWVPVVRRQNEAWRTSEDADGRQHDESELSSWRLVDPAHLGWPGGGEPRFPMQL